MGNPHKPQPPKPAPLPDPMIAAAQREIEARNLTIAGKNAEIAAKDAALKASEQARVAAVTEVGVQQALVAARDSAIAAKDQELAKLRAQSFDVTLSVFNPGTKTVDFVTVTGKPPVNGFVVEDIPLSLNMEPPCSINLDVRPTPPPKTPATVSPDSSLVSPT